MNLVDKVLVLLEETRVLVVNNYDTTKCENCKRIRNVAEFYPHELKRIKPVCKMCRQKSRLEKKFKRDYNV